MSPFRPRILPRAPGVALLCTLCCLSLLACDPEGDENPFVATDMTTSTGDDMAVEDMPIEQDAGADLDAPDMSGDEGGDDLGGDQDATMDMDDMTIEEPTCEAFPELRFGTDAVVTELARSPARCQQEPYTWSNDPSLGDVRQQGEVTKYKAQLLEALAQGAGVEIPVELEYDVNVRTIEYVTQARGELRLATAFVAAPEPKAGQEQDFKTLVFLHGTSGFKDGCGPSSDSETKLLAAAIASAGYVIVGPDYLGLKGLGEPSEEIHPYLVGESVAMSSIDAVRALGKLDLFEEQGACASKELLVLGGSQGGHAALWFDRLLPYYGAEFELLGTVATVPPADLVGQIERALSMPVQASANVIAFWTTASVWYGIGERLSEVFISPYDEDLPGAFAASCDPTDEVPIDKVTDLSEIFTADALSWASDISEQPTWGCMAVENGLVTTSVARLDESPNYADTYSIFWVLGEEDKLVNTPIERVAYQSLCEQGMPMYFLECAGASHTQGTSWALPEILTFIEQRAARAPLMEQGQCELSAPQTCAGTPVE